MELSLSFALHLPPYLVAPILILVAGVMVTWLGKRSTRPTPPEMELPKKIENPARAPQIPEGAPVKLARNAWPGTGTTLN
jgi:hypothetical protein